MKKMLLLPACLMFTAILNIGTATAQYSQKEQLKERSILLRASATMVTSEADKTALAYLKATNSKAGRDFEKHFSNASDLRISNHGKNTFVTFMADGIRNRIYYNSKGKRESLLRYLNEGQIPKAVALLVESSYPGYSIYSETIEVTVGNKMAHLVLIENCNSWKRVKVVDGEVEIFEEYNK